jgi:hypothetical protein
MATAPRPRSIKPALLLSVLLLGAAPAFAALDIVATKPGDDSSPYVLKNTATGKVLGTFWNPETEASDYGFSSGRAPEFFWSADRAYMAVNDRDNNGRWGGVSLYQVAKDTLKPVQIPELPAGSADALAAVRAKQLAADITTAVRWQPDGTLLLRYFAASRETDTEPQVEARLWAEVKVQGGAATIVATSPVEPPASRGKSGR